MGNHTVDCDYCGLDTRGLSGVPGCPSQTRASTCFHYLETLREDRPQENLMDVARDFSGHALELGDLVVEHGPYMYGGSLEGTEFGIVMGTRIFRHGDHAHWETTLLTTYNDWCGRSNVPALSLITLKKGNLFLESIRGRIQKVRAVNKAKFNTEGR